jgi:small subunit ribosomal protein S20
VANIKSQIKRNRQNDKKRLRNRVYRGEARIAVKNARSTIEEGVPESKAALMDAISALDKAAEQGVIHKNNAARRKSRLMKAFTKMQPVKAEAGPVAVEPVVEPEPSDASPAEKKKSTSRKSAAGKKVEEPKAEAVESKAEAKKTTTRKQAAQKAETKKPAATSSPKGKKAETKKPAAKSSPREKKVTPKKPTAKK